MNKKQIIISLVLLIFTAIFAGLFFLKFQVINDADDIVATNIPVNDSNVDATNDEEVKKEYIQEKEVDENIVQEYMNPFYFAFDGSCNYEEEEITSRSEYTGNVIRYTDQNNSCPSFNIVSRDFEVEGMNFWDLIVFDDNKENMPHYIMNSKDYEQVVELKDDVFQITGFSNYECSPGISSKLVYVLPESSSYKYIIFHLGTEDFSEDDFIDVCEPKEEVVISKIKNITDKKNEGVNSNLKIALDILNTMNVSEINEYTSTCPPDDFDWLKFHPLTEDELTIECIIDDTNKLVLKAREVDSKPSPVYKVYLSLNNSELYLGTTPVFGFSEVEFDIDTFSNEVIHIYDIQRDMAGYIENGWYINIESEKVMKYISHRIEIDFDLDEKTYKIEYSTQKVGNDIEIDGLLLNENMVVSFDTPIIIKYNPKDELVPYEFPSIDISSINSELDIIKIEIDEKKYEIPFDSEN